MTLRDARTLAVRALALKMTDPDGYRFRLFRLMERTGLTLSEIERRIVVLSQLTETEL